MSNQIDFYFDIISPFSFIAHKKIQKINQSKNIIFNYKPIFLGGLHKLAEIDAPAFNKYKIKILQSDCELIAEKNNMFTLNGFDVFCNEVKKTCNLFNDNGKPYIIDASHLSIEGIERTKIWLYVEIMDIINSTNFFENKLYLEKNRLEKNK